MSAPFWWHSHKEKERSELAVSERFKAGPKVSELFERLADTPVEPDVTRPIPPPPPAKAIETMPETIADRRTARERYVDEMKERIYGSQSQPIPESDALGRRD